MILSSAIAAARRYFTGMFFYPDVDDFGSPGDLGITFEDVHFKSGVADLHGFLMRAAAPARGLILHCHGNAGNVTSHTSQVRFLVEAGYDVLTFDYAGFGRSSGQPSLPGIEDDARAALAFLLTRTDLPLDRIAVFGQSLGGAAAAAAAIHPAVRALILEATFTTYRHIAWSTVIGRSLFFLVPGVIPDGGPARQLKAFAPRPVLLIHGEADSVVSHRFSRRLHSMFPAFTTLETQADVGHLTPGATETSPFRNTVLIFLDRHLGRH